MLPEETYPWFAVRVKPRWEKDVARNLRWKGCAELLPLYVRETRWSDRIKRVELPLFPGYLFASFDPRRPMLVLSTPGVLSVISCGKDPLPLPHSELEAIQATMRSGLQREPRAYPHNGDLVRLIAGPLKGVQGVVSSVEDVDWLILSVTLLQRAIAVRVESQWVEFLKTGTGRSELGHPDLAIPSPNAGALEWPGRTSPL